MSRFQLIFTVILVVLGVGGAILFAISKNEGAQGAPQVVLWGTLDDRVVSNFIAKMAVENRDTLNVNYRQRSAATFESELIAALARGAGPDMILLPHDLIVKQIDKYYVVPYENYSARTFKDSFIEGSELYLNPSGVLGFPFSVDPIVMYWNRDIFSDAGLAAPPSTWTEFLALAPKIVEKDANGNISQSLVAFGEVRNVSHAKEMLSLLSIQAGTPIVSRNSTGFLTSVLAARGTGLVPGESALQYFTEFSNPSKSTYSWNRSLPNDKNAFAAGRLAVYFGYASELANIRAANPNLNFDVALVPQTGGKKSTYGSFTAIAILRSTNNLSAAYTAAMTLTSAPIQAQWIEASGLPPVRRDLLAALPGDPYKAVFHQSALISKAWLDPNRERTSDIFMRMVENVTSGKMRVSQAVNSASLEIDSLFTN
jgi:multiple sugar transport system substrate-binding protein